MKTINLQGIRIDGGTQSRVELCQSTVKDYAEAIRDGVKLPAVVVYFDGTDYWLADGFHRYHATKTAGTASIAAEVREGTKRDAVLCAAGANATHGLRRTNADKRHAVQMLLDDAEAAQWSDRDIARHCGVTHPFVASVRSPKLVTAATRSNQKSAAPAKADVAITAPESAASAESVVTVTTQLPVVEPGDHSDELSEARDTIVALSVENEQLRAKLAVEQMEASEDDKTAAATLIAALRAQVATLTAELEAIRVSRDGFQSENTRLKKQIAMQQRQLEMTRASA